MNNQLTNELNAFKNEILTPPSITPAETEAHTPPLTPVQNPQYSQNHPFPVDALPDTLKRITMEAADACLVPQSLAAMVSIGCLSTAIGGGLCIASTNGRTLNGNLFLLIVAKSGSGKGTTYSTIASPLLECDRDKKENWRLLNVPDLIVKQSLLQEQIKIEKSKASKPGASTDVYKDLQRESKLIEDELARPPTLLVGETTEQKLAMIMSGQNLEAVGNHSAEARGIIKIILGRFGGGNDTGETIYLAGYSGDSYSVERTTRDDISLRNPCLSTLFMIQPDAMKQLTTSEAMTQSGFMPRFLMADVHADLEDDPEDNLRVSDETSAEWAKLIRDVVHYCRDNPDKTVVNLTKDAGDMLREESNRVKRLGRTGASLERFHSYVARYGENLRKLHLVLHVAKYGKDAEDHEADVETSQKAIEIARWFLDESLTILRSGQIEKMQKRMARLVKIINETKTKEITMRDLKKSHTITEQDIAELQETFPDTLELGERKHAKGGRPSTIVRLVG